MKKKHSIWIASAALVLSLSACQGQRIARRDNGKGRGDAKLQRGCHPPTLPLFIEEEWGNTRAATPDKKLPAGAR